MVVLAHVEVDLGETLQSGGRIGIDEQRDVDPVAGDERELEQELAPRRHLAGERLAHRGQVGEEALEQGASGQLGHPASALGDHRLPQPERAAVEALDERHVGFADQRAEQPEREVGPELLGVGVQEADHLAAQHV